MARTEISFRRYPDWPNFSLFARGEVEPPSNMSRGNPLPTPRDRIFVTPWIPVCISPDSTERFRNVTRNWGVGGGAPFRKVPFLQSPKAGSWMVSVFKGRETVARFERRYVEDVGSLARPTEPAVKRTSCPAIFVCRSTVANLTASTLQRRQCSEMHRADSTSTNRTTSAVQ